MWRVSEGITAGGVTSEVVDAFGHKYLSGVGKWLEGYTKEHIGCKVRSIELNVMQRCSSHIASLTDLNEAERIGREAVKAALTYGESGVMMAFRRISNNPYRVEIVTADISKIANQERNSPGVDKSRGKQRDRRRAELFPAADPGRAAA